MAYKIVYDARVLQELENIYRYILERFKSESSARRRVEELMDTISALAIFPEAGFDADEKFDRKIHPKYKNRGLTLRKDYIALYFVDYERETIVLTYLLPTRNDYIKLFKSF